MKESSEKRPPIWLGKLLRWYCHPELLEEIQGDTDELYVRRIAKYGAQKAKMKYAWDVIRYFRWSNIKKPKTQLSSHNYTAMLNNYFKIGVRKILRYKFHYSLNVIGLSTGIAACLYLFMIVHEELTYDRHNEKFEKIYRVNALDIDKTDNTRFTSVPSHLSALIKSRYGEVEQTTRIFPSSKITRYKDKKFTESKLFYADSSVFDIFTINFIAGDPKTALSHQNTIVLTEKNG